MKSHYRRIDAIPVLAARCKSNVASRPAAHVHRAIRFSCNTINNNTLGNVSKLK